MIKHDVVIALKSAVFLANSINAQGALLWNNIRGDTIEVFKTNNFYFWYISKLSSLPNLSGFQGFSEDSNPI